MALNKGTLKADIKSLLTSNAESEDKTQSLEYFSSGLADIIDGYVKSQTITVSGVVTVGSAATQTQTAPVTATIS